MPYTKLCRKWHNDRREEKEREKELIGSVSAINLVCLKFIYSEKATKFCEIFPLLLTVCNVVKSKGKFSQNFVAFSEYMNFNISRYILICQE